MKKLLSVLLLSISSQSITYAQSLGMDDIWIAIKQLKELQAHYRVLKDTYNKTKDQLNSLNNLKDMNSGHYGWGNLDNGLDALQNWQSPASTWQEALHNLSGGNPERYRALIEAYEKNHPGLNETNYARYATPQHVTRFKEDKAVNRAVQVQTSESYNEINKHIATLHKLSQQIEKTDNTKGAIDLNSRLVSELGFIQLMSLRLQTLMNQQMAQVSLAELQDRAEMAEFNRIPTN